MCTAHVRALWKTDFGEVISDDEWDGVWSTSGSFWLNDKPFKFFQIWDPFLEYIGDDGAQALRSGLCGLAWAEVSERIPRP